MNTVDVLIQQEANVHGGDNIMRTVSQVTVGALVTITVEGGTMIYLRVTGSAPIHVAAAHGQTNVFFQNQNLESKGENKEDFEKVFEEKTIKAYITMKIRMNQMNNAMKAML